MTGVPQFLQAMTMISYLFFHWKGAMDHQSIQLKVFVNRNHVAAVSQWYLIYYEDGKEDLITKQLPIVTTLAPIAINIDGLKPLTKYKYFFYFDQLQNLRVDEIATKQELYQFKTLQEPFLKQNLSFSFSSCAKTGSEDPVFQDIIDLFPDHQFFVQMGDIFYGDINENSEILYDESYYRLFQSKVQNKLYSYYPIIYIWDDHDFGDNNSGEYSPGNEAATSSFLRNALYYPMRTLPPNLPQPPSKSEGIYQYVIAGQTLIVIMDLRTHFRSNERAMDEIQLDWVLKILEWCKTNDKIDNLILVSSIPWSGQDWVSFTEQRKIIGNKMAEVMKVKQNVLLISGDSHMVAFDNGYNNDAGGFPTCISSPLDKTPSCKGGEYTYGPFSGNSQYSTLDVTYDPITKKNCFLVRGWRSKSLLYQFDSCNESDLKLTYSNTCFTSVAQIFLFSIIPIMFVVLVLLILWRYSKKFSQSLSHVSQPYVEIPNTSKNQPNVIQNIEALSSANKQYIPNTSFKGNSSQKLNLQDNEFYGNLCKSPSFPPNNSQIPIFNPSFLKNIEEKEIITDKI